MIMQTAGIDYSYEICWDYFGKPWLDIKQDIPFGQLPILIVDCTGIIFQSNSIIRYLAPFTGHMPEDQLLASKVDSLFESAHDLFPPLNPVINVRWGKAFETGKAELEEILPAKLAHFAKQYDRYDGPFFFGDAPYYCDFAAFHHFDMAELLMPEILTAFQGLQRFMVAMRSFPKIQQFLDTRPELINVGVDSRMRTVKGEVSTGPFPALRSL